MYLSIRGLSAYLTAGSAGMYTTQNLKCFIYIGFSSISEAIVCQQQDIDRSVENIPINR